MNDSKLEIVLAAKDITGNTFDKVQDSITGLGKSIVSVNGIIAGFAGATGLGLIAKQSIDAVAEIDRLSTMAGVTAESFQELSFAADQYQISQDALTDGLKELSLRGDEFARDGAGPAKDAFERLGYSADDLNAMLNDTPGLLSDIISRMEGLDKAAQIRIADEIFGGTGGEQFVAMVQGGAKALDGMRQSAHDLGVVIDDDMVKQSVEAKKQVEQLTTVLSTQFNSVVAELAPDIADMATNTLDWVKANKDLIGQGIDSVVNGIGDAFDYVERTISKTNTAMEKLIGFYDKLPKGLINKESIGKFIDAQYAEGKDVSEMIARLNAGVLDNPDVILRPITGDYTPGIPKKNDSGLDSLQIGSGGGEGTKKLSKEVKDLIDANLEGWFNDVDQAAQKYVDLFAEGARVTLAMRTPTEQLAGETARLNELLDIGAINAETYGRAMAQAQELIDEAKEAELSKLDAIKESFMSEEDLLLESFERKREIILENTAITEQERIALVEQLNQSYLERQQAMEQERQSLLLSSSASLFGEMASLSKTFAGEQSGIYKAMFAVSKGFAIAEATISVTQAIAKAAASTMWPANLAAMASVAGATANLVGQISSVNFSGAYDTGGFIPAGSVGLVGEIGPELVSGPAMVTSRRDTADILERGKGKDTIIANFYISTEKPQSFNRSRGEIESKMVSTLRRARRRSG